LERSAKTHALLARLEKQRLVHSRSAPRGGRDGRLYHLTKRGSDRLDTWLGPPFDPDVVSIAMDPLRTRVHFLGTLTQRRRRALLDGARAELERHLADLAAAPVADAFDRLALHGAVRLTRARIAWLDEMRRKIARVAASPLKGRRKGRRPGR
jgi:DNA-binding PadR family transcriptional regulator